MRRQNQRMSRKDDQPSAARAVAFLQRKHGEALPKETSAYSDGFALIFVENTSNTAKPSRRKRLFPYGRASPLALAFLVLFCHQKSTENKFFRRKPLKKILPDLTYSYFVLKLNLKRNSNKKAI